MVPHLTEISPSSLLEGRPTLVLSPHLDDAILSAASLVLAHPCEVWTVFTGRPTPAMTTSWDLSCGFSDSDETMDARLVEDAKAFAQTPSQTRHLGLIEGAYAEPDVRRAELPVLRAELHTWLTQHPDGVLVIPACAGLHVPPPVWAPVLTLISQFRDKTAPRAVPSEKTLPSEGAESGNVSCTEETSPQEITPASPQTRLFTLVNRLQRMAKQPIQRLLHAEHLHRRNKIIGAQGLAANPDHIDVRDLAIDVVRAYPGVKLLLFEDLPYLWHESGDAEVARVSKRENLAFAKLGLTVDKAMKYAALSHYSSQLPVLDRRGRLQTASTLPSKENFWQHR